MSSRRQLMMLVAIVFAALAAASVYAYLGQTTNKSIAAQQTVEVYTIGQDIQRLDPGSKVVDSVVPKKIPLVDLPDGRITTADAAKLQELRTRIAAYDLRKGQILVDSMLVDKNYVTPQASYRLDKDMVAVSVSVDDVHASGGNLQPGDYVNILALMTPLADDPGTPVDDTKLKYTFTVYQKVKILYIGQAPAPQPGDVQSNPKNGTAAAAPVAGSGVVTFEVPPQAASRIVELSSAGGGLTLTLVNPDYQPVDVPVISNEFAIPDKSGYKKEWVVPGKSDIQNTPYPDGKGPTQ